MTKTLNITDEMKEAARKVFTAQAKTAVIREIVTRYQTVILKEMDKFAKFGPRSTQKVLDPKHSYLLTDEDFKVYLKRCNEARKSAKLHVDNEEFCPLLVAETEQIKAERELIDILFPITGCSAEKVTRNPKYYDKFMYLALCMLSPDTRII